MVQKTPKSCWHWLRSYNPLMLGDDLHHIFKATLHVLNSSHGIILKKGINYKMMLLRTHTHWLPLSLQVHPWSSHSLHSHPPLFKNWSPFMLQKQNCYLSHEGRRKKEEGTDLKWSLWDDVRKVWSRTLRKPSFNNIRVVGKSTTTSTLRGRPMAPSVCSAAVVTVRGTWLSSSFCLRLCNNAALYETLPLPLSSSLCCG